MEIPQKIYTSHEQMEKIKKIFETRGFKIPDKTPGKEKYQKSKKVIQSGKSKHTTENPCSVCGETNWILLPDGRKYCLKCGGVDTDKKPTHEPPKSETKVIIRRINMFKAFIGIPNGETENVRKVCEEIKKKDVTFRYDIMKTTLEAKDKNGIALKDKFENLLVLYSSTLDDANKRAGWFIHKCKNAKLAEYFWVKEY